MLIFCKVEGPVYDITLVRYFFTIKPTFRVSYGFPRGTIEGQSIRLCSGSGW